jgi:hypothetical protein
MRVFKHNAHRRADRADLGPIRECVFLPEPLDWPWNRHRYSATGLGKHELILSFLLNLNISTARMQRRVTQAIPIKKSSRASAAGGSRTSDANVPLTLQQRRQSGGRISRTSSAGFPELYLGHDLSPSGAWKRVNIPLVCYRAALPVILMILSIALCQSQRNR